MEVPDGNAIGLDSDIKVSYTVTGLGNPEWGLTRSSGSTFVWNFDVNDANVFTIYDLWTNQFDVKITDSNT